MNYSVMPLAGFTANVTTLAAALPALGGLPVASAGLGLDDFLHGSVVILVALVWIRRLRCIATSPHFLTIIGISAVIIGGAAWLRTHPELLPGSTPAARQMHDVQAAVRSYMLSRTSSPSSIQFLEWSDLQNSGPDSFVTLRYDATQRSGNKTTATVRFTVRSGTVTNAQVLRQG